MNTLPRTTPATNFLTYTSMCKNHGPSPETDPHRRLVGVGGIFFFYFSSSREHVALHMLAVRPGQGLEFQGHDPRKVECMTDSSASVLRLVIVLSLAVWMARSRWRGIVVLAVLRQRRLSYDVMKAWRGDSIRSEVLGCDTKVFSTRNQRAHARGSDACRCCNPWEAQPWLPSPRQGSM
jgi:hypothetical protein